MGGLCLSSPRSRSEFTCGKGYGNVGSTKECKQQQPNGLTAPGSAVSPVPLRSFHPEQTTETCLLSSQTSFVIPGTDHHAVGFCCFFSFLFRSCSPEVWACTCSASAPLSYPRPFFFFFLRQFHYVAQAGLKLVILMPLPPKCCYHKF